MTSLDNALPASHARDLTMNTGGDVLVARVTVDDETLIVEATEVGKALLALHGSPKPGMDVVANITFNVMQRSEFDAIPEYQ